MTYTITSKAHEIAGEEQGRQWFLGLSPEEARELAPHVLDGGLAWEWERHFWKEPSPAFWAGAKSTAAELLAEKGK